MPASLKLFKTSTFRLAAVYLVVFLLSVGAILGYVLVRFPTLLNPFAGGGGMRRGPSRQERTRRQ